jgi:transcriptional regulator of arginine metabolism
MTRNQRLSAIKEIIKENKIASQESLIEELAGRGFNVTQATVSRDIQFLNLVKVRDLQNNEFYSIKSSYQSDPQFRQNRLKIKFKENVVSIQDAGNILVIKTLPGEAQGVAAVIDGSNFTEILGTVAGDDTIICVVENEKGAEKMSVFFMNL